MLQLILQRTSSAMPTRVPRGDRRSSILSPTNGSVRRRSSQHDRISAGWRRSIRLNRVAVGAHLELVTQEVVSFRAIQRSPDNATDDNLPVDIVDIPGAGHAEPHGAPEDEDVGIPRINVNGDVSIPTTNPETREAAVMMSIVVQPSTHTQPNTCLQPPIVIQILSLVGRSTGENEAVDAESMSAMVSLMSADGTTPLAPPRTDLLAGTLFRSFGNVLMSPRSREVGSLTFYDINIRQPGQYSLRFSLFRRQSNGSPAMIHVQSVCSEPISVVAIVESSSGRLVD